MVPGPARWPSPSAWCRSCPDPVPYRTGSGDAADAFGWQTPPQSIGRVHTWHGNTLVLARALAYILANGGDGLKQIAQVAVLNANWIRQRLHTTYDVPFDRPCMHEVVLSTRTLKAEHGVRALDVAKRLLEEGFHAPTVYFPLIVEEALMIEPTETESPQTLEALAASLERIAAEAARDGAEALATLPPRHPGAAGGRGPGGPHPDPDLRRQGLRGSFGGRDLHDPIRRPLPEVPQVGLRVVGRAGRQALQPHPGAAAHHHRAEVRTGSAPTG